MKKAEGILSNQQHGFNKGKFESAINAMKVYAAICCEQALKDAAENARIEPKYKLSAGFMDQYKVNKDSILNTKIKLP